MSVSILTKTLPSRVLTTILTCAVAVSWVTFSVFSAPQADADSGVGNNRIASENQSTDATVVLQTDQHFVRRLNLATNDLIYNAPDQRIYVSVPSSAGAIGNSLTQINPRTGEIGASVFVGSEPNKLARANDNQTLYVSLDGAFAIQRFNTETQTAGAQFAVGRDSSYGIYTVNDLAVAPDNPNIVAVARYYPGTSPPVAGVAVFDNGVQRQRTGPSHISGSDFLAFSATGSTLYGGGYYYGLRTMQIDAAGVTVLDTTSFSVGARIKFSNGLIFSSTGQVINAASKTLLGTFPNAVSNAFVPDTAAGRAFYLVRENYGSNLTLKVFDINTFVEIGSLALPATSGDVTSLVRWGANGLAYRTSSNEVYLIQTSFIPSSEPIPTPTPSVSPTPTVTPSPYSAFVRQINLATNDLVYNQTTQKIYASVPSIAGSGVGNTITTLDPTTGGIENSVFVGSEPNKLALADDAQTLYVGLDGSGAVRRFNINLQAAAQSFSLGTSGSSGVYTASDLAVMPGSPSVVAVSRTNSTVAIYDNGTMRPMTQGGGPLAFASATRLYSGSGPVVKMNVNNTGLALVSSFPVNSYGNKIVYAPNGGLYFPGGRAVNPDTETIIGTYANLGYESLMAVDTSLNRIFFLTSVSGNWSLRAYDLYTFRLIGTAFLQGISGTPTSLVRWGANGLAFRTGEGKVFLVQSTLVNPATTTPTPTPTVTPTPTPSPTYIPTFVRRVNLQNNDLVYNQSNNTIYASVPGTGGAGRGNTITEVNPLTGELGQSVFIGSEPGKLALADDSRTLYASLNGANAIRRYDFQTRTPGLQFVPNPNFIRPQDIEVLPGNPNSIALAGHTNGVAIYDNGVQRPNANTGGAYSINAIEFGGSAAILYGYDNYSSGFELVKFAVNSSGVSAASITYNLISGYGVDMKYANGLLYTTTGRIVDPENRTQLGMVQGSGSTMAVDPALGRIFFLSNNVLSAYDLSTFVKIGSVTLPLNNTYSSSLVRWGANGLAFRTSNSSSSSSSNDSQIYIVQSSLVSSTGSVPTGLQLSAATYAAYEGNQNVGITVNRTGDVSAQTTVAYATVDETAKAGSDYTAVSGTLTFAPGETSKTVTVPLINNNVYEGVNKTFTLTLSNPSGGALLTAPAATTVTISDDESRPYINNSTISVMEPRTGTSLAAFTLRLSNASTQTVTVAYSTSNGTALAGSDYVATSGTLTFNPLETVKTVAVAVNADNVNEPDETFFLNLSSPSNASIGITQTAAVIRNFNLQTARRVPFDFDGDFKADISVFRPSSGNWFINRSSNNAFSAQNFGLSGDLLTPGDFDGDGLTDVSVFRDGFWYRLNSSDNKFVAVQFGQAGDIPVAGDFDGDKKADIAVFRPSNGYWYRLNSTNNQFVYQHFGMTGDKPVAGDFDGDGKTDFAVFRPSAASWYVLRSTNNSFYGVRFGIETDIPQVADFDGDGRADMAVFRAGNWYRTNSSNAQFVAEQFGLPTDIPAAADYDGDGRADVAVFRPSNGTWYFNGSAIGFSGVQFGAGEDKPVPSAYVP
jgi:hypothetical protein